MSCGEASMPYAHAAGVHRDELLVKAGKAALVLGNQLRLEAATPVARNRQVNRLVLRQNGLLAVAIAAIAGLLAFRNLILRRICKVMVHLSVQNPLSEGFF
jgi:hypothetical protein